MDKTNKKIGDFFGIKVVTKEDEYTQESIREKVEDFTKDMTKEEFHSDSLRYYQAQLLTPVEAEVYLIAKLST